MKGEYVRFLTYIKCMEFTKDIEFNNKPQSNTNLEIKYSGFLANSPELWIVYGYNEAWEHTTELKMEKQENKFSAKINVLDYNTINFCFKNAYNQWDNNNSYNYISSICPSFDSEIISLFNELFSEDTDKLTATNNIQSENTELNTSNEFDFDQLIEEILQPLANQPVQIELSEPEIHENSIDLGEEISSLLSNISNNSVTETNINSTEVIDENYIELENETNDKLSYNKITNDNSNEALLNENLSKALSELFTNDYSEKTFSELSTNETVENTFSAISTKESIEDNTSTISTNELTENKISEISTNDANLIDENTIKEKIQEITKDVIDTKELDMSNRPVSDQFAISPRKLNRFYTYRKRIKLFFYKVFFKFPKSLFDTDNA